VIFFFFFVLGGFCLLLCFHVKTSYDFFFRALVLTPTATASFFLLGCCGELSPSRCALSHGKGAPIKAAKHSSSNTNRDVDECFNTKVAVLASDFESTQSFCVICCICLKSDFCSYVLFFFLLVLLLLLFTIRQLSLKVAKRLLLFSSLMVLKEGRGGRRGGAFSLTKRCTLPSFCFFF
jgi:hypothetical protein